MIHDKALGRSGLQESPQAPVGLSTANSPRWELTVVSSAVPLGGFSALPGTPRAGRLFPVAEHGQTIYRTAERNQDIRR